MCMYARMFISPYTRKGIMRRVDNTLGGRSGVVGYVRYENRRKGLSGKSPSQEDRVWVDTEGATRGTL